MMAATRPNVPTKLRAQVAAAFVMSPPIRSPEHQRQLKAGLAGGVLTVLATDHCPFNSTQKRLGLHDFRVIPNGVHGLEERIHVGWDALVHSGGPAALKREYRTCTEPGAELAPGCTLRRAHPHLLGRGHPHRSAAALARGSQGGSRVPPPCLRMCGTW